MVQRTLTPKKVTREELSALVDRAVDLIRTTVDYKFILVLLFMKRSNDLWKVEKCQVKEGLKKEADVEAEKEVHHTFNISKQFLWDEIRKELGLYLRSLRQPSAKLPNNLIFKKEISSIGRLELMVKSL